jgi:lysophospholipase L1-like esterase
MVADDPAQRVTAAQLIAAMQQLVERAHARGVRVMGATLLPREGAQGARAHTPAGEALRQELNAWIRDGGGFDAVVDFDRVLRDPERPGRQRPELNSGDFSHPNAAGYAAMAQAIDLQQFKH